MVSSPSIYSDIGNYTDLLGEFGRLVVDPEHRVKGVGSMPMAERPRFAKRRLHFGLANARSRHVFAQRIARRFEFRPIGFLPLASLFEERESSTVMAKLFSRRWNCVEIIQGSF